MEQSNKVRPLVTGQERKGTVDPDGEKIMEETRKDMGKVALFISLLAVIMVVILFFGLNQNITGLSGQVEELNSLQQSVDELNVRMAEMENLPQQTRNIILSNALEEMSLQVEYMSGQVEDDQAGKLSQAQTLLNEVRQQLNP